MTPRVPLQARVISGGTAHGTAIYGWPAMALFTPVSAALHVLAVAVLLWRPSLSPALPPAAEEGGTVQVEYVNHPATQKGAAAPGEAQTTAKPAPAAQASQAEPPPPPPSEAAAPPEPPPTPQSAAEAPQTGQPSIRLGDSDEDSDALSVTGDNVVSSGPDAKYRNLPPRYPREAARRHEQGTVETLIHITPDGAPGEIEIIASSGSRSLDEATREAVMKWHFKPAIHNGEPVASVYPLRVQFRNENQ